MLRLVNRGKVGGRVVVVGLTKWRWWLGGEVAVLTTTTMMGW